MLLKVHPENPSQRQIKRVVDTLQNDGIIIYPTDTVYALGWSIENHKAKERVSKIRQEKKKDKNYSLICNNLSQVSEFVKRMDKSTFKLLRHNLPGPFTFILPTNHKFPQYYNSKKKSVGIRIPDNNIPLQIVEEMGAPLMTTSLRFDDEIQEYLADPEMIAEKYEKVVDIFVHGGLGNLEPSTVIDCTQDTPEVIRQGIGEIKE